METDLALDEREFVFFAREALAKLNGSFAKAKLLSMEEIMTHHTSSCRRQWKMVFQRRVKTSSGKIEKQDIHVELKLRCGLEYRSKFHENHVWKERTATIKLKGQRAVIIKHAA